MPKAPRIDSDAELARALGIDRALVCRLKRRGMPTDNVEAAQAWRAANVRARVGGKPSAGNATSAQGDYSVFRARRERAEAERAEVLAMRAKQTVILREPAERAVFEVFRGLRDASFAAMRNVAPAVSGMNDVRQVQLELEDALRTAYEGFARDMERRLETLKSEASA